MYYAAANFARLTENTNIFSAQYYGVDSVSSNSADSRLRERSTTMVYSHLAEIEKNSTSRAVFHDVWAALNADTDKFSGLTETDFYSGVLWAMMVGDMNASQKPVEAKMEDFEGVANGMIMEFAEWYCVDVARETSTEKAKEVLEDWEKEDASLLETVQIWYGDHYSTISEEIEAEKSFFKNVDDVFEKGSKVMQFCGTAIEYITKMSQLEALYGMSHDAYLSFLKALSAEENIDPQLKIASDNLITLMNSDNYRDALDDYLLQLVCHDGMELALDKVSDILKDVAENALSKVSSNAIAGGVLLGVKLGMEAANLLLGVEDKLAIRYNILLLSSMTDSVFDASKQLRTDYYNILPDAVEEYLTQETINAELGEAADAYVASIEMCYRFLLQTDTYASQYVNENYNDWWNSSKETFNTYNDTIEEEIDGLTSSYNRLIATVQEQYSMYYDQLVNNIIYKADGWENVSLPTRKEYWLDATITLIVPTKEGYKFEGWIDNVTGKIYESGSSFTANYSEDTILEPLWTYDAAAKVPASFDEAKGMVDFSTSVAGTTAGRIRYMAQVTGDSYFVSDYWKYTANGTTGTISPGNKCTRCALSMALSYLGLDYTPGYMSTLYGSSNIPSPLVDVPAKIDAVSRVDSSNFDLLWSNYAANMNYTPVVLYFDYLHPNDNTMHEHAILVIGQNGNTYYAVDSAANQTHLVEFTFNADKSAIATCSYERYANSSKIKASCQWQSTSAQKETYTITYDWTDNIVTTRHGEKQHGVDCYLSNEIPTRQGYTFLGWALETDLQTPVYQPGQIYTNNADLYLYAVWTTGTITLTGTVKDATSGGANYGEPLQSVKVEFFDANGNSVGTATTDQNGSYTFTLPAAGSYKRTYTKAGYQIFTSSYQTYNANSPSFGVATMIEVGSDIVAEGTCGENLTWVLNDTGLLSISGEGEMFGYENGYQVPWYSSRNSIKQIIVEDGVTSIGFFAFNDCSGLTNAIIPDSVTAICDYAFHNCSSLTDVTIPDNVTMIGSYAFSRCDSLTTVTIPNSVTSIGGWVFHGCSNLASVTISDSVRTIGYAAFYDCSNLASVTIPDSVTVIREYAFKNCWRLNDLKIGNGVNTIQGGAFAGCVNLTDVMLPDSVRTIGFAAFRECGNLTSVVIPNGVTEIGDWTFYSCWKLTNVTIPDSVTTIGQYAFHDCRSLTDVTIPNTVVTIGDYAFNWSALTSVTIPDGVTTIGNHAFDSCTNLIDVKIGNGVTTIGKYAFDNCTNLANAAIGNGVVTIGDGAFYQCYDLTNVTIPVSVVTIGKYAFYGCSDLTSVEIGNGVRAIEDGAFACCDNLTSVTIPPNVVTIGDDVFIGCRKLQEIVVNEDSRYYVDLDGVLFSSDKSELLCFPANKTLTVYVIPDGVTTIRSGAFYDYDKLKDVTIPDGVTTIGHRVFYSCDGLTNITIPDSVTDIGDYAFWDCSNLSKMIVGRGVTTIGAGAFLYSRNLKTVYFEGNAPTVTTNSEETPSFVADTVTLYHNPDTSGWTDSNVYDAKNGTWNGYKLAVWTGVVPTASGYCGGEGNGTNLIWILDDEGTLTISGNGAMADYTTTWAPWDDYTESIKRVVIGDEVTTIGGLAFAYCTNLTNVTIPDSVTAIGFGAFMLCPGLTEITVSEKNSAYSSEDGVLFDQEKTTIIQYPGGRTTTAYTVPNSVTTINMGAFAYSFGLNQVTIPSSVTDIGLAAFAFCPFLTEITVSEKNSAYSSKDGVLFDKEKTTLLQYPGGSCRADYTVPDGVTTVGMGAFTYCKDLVSVTIPASVKAIGDDAFMTCMSLTDAYFMGNAPVMGSAYADSPAFSDATTLYYVPGTTGWTDCDAYDAAAGTWNGYKLKTWKPEGTVSTSPVTSIKVTEKRKVECTIEAETACFSQVLVGAYHPTTGAFIGVATGEYDGTSNILSVTFNMDLPEDYVLKAFCVDDNFAPMYKVTEFPSTR